jgi:hypothetical protein
MIHVITVHWMTPRWVEPQLGYLERNMGAPYRVVASLNGIDDPGLRARFDVAADLEGKHPAKLNALAQMVADGADPSDVVIFLDGDAFPVRPLVPWLEEALRRHALVAVRRDENLGDPQPHPSFCATTVGFWQEIGGDWRGGDWVNTAGMTVRDTGGRLLHTLRARQIDWLPMVRTNTNDPHPLWFGVYAHRVYHHGAGFQAARVERVEWAGRFQRVGVGRTALRPTPESPSLGTLRRAFGREPSTILRTPPRVVGRAAVKTWRLRREHRYFEHHARSEDSRRLEHLNEEMFARLVVDPEFHRELDATAMP